MIHSVAVRKIAVVFYIIIGLAFECGLAYGQQTNIDSGLTYLQSTQNPDGSWGGTVTSLNTVFQTTSTTARTLQLLGVTDTSLTNAINFLSAQSLDTVDDLSQQLEVLAASGADVSSSVSLIQAAQQPDGGWGIDLDKGFPSEVVDTLSAMRALKVASSLDATATSAALGYFLGAQNTDGGWGVSKDQPSEVFYTALVLLVLKDFQQSFNLTTSLTAGAQFLVAQQNPDGSFGGSVFETAVAFQALVRYTLDPTNRDAATLYLTSTQLVDGSWDEDAFTTGLVLRALNDAQTISQAQIQSITLSKILEDGTRMPTFNYGAFDKMAIEITVADPNLGLEVIVQDSVGATYLPIIIGEGEYLFDTLNLSPGIYTVIVRALDSNISIIVDEQTVDFTIDPTFNIISTTISVSPEFTHVGATEAISLNVSLENRSNISTNITINYEIKTPSGAILNSGVAQDSLNPNETSKIVTPANFAHTFTEDGAYPVQIDVFDGATLLATVNGTISAAPLVRIDPSKTLTPQEVTPDADRRIRIDIQLEGVEQMP